MILRIQCCSSIVLLVMVMTTTDALAFLTMTTTKPDRERTRTRIVLPVSLANNPSSSSSSEKKINNRNNHNQNKYQRRNIPETERRYKDMQAKRQAAYEQLKNKAPTSPLINIWSFDSLFPEPQYDELSIQRDLYDGRARSASLNLPSSTPPPQSSTPPLFAPWKTASDSVLRLLKRHNNNKPSSSTTATTATTTLDHPQNSTTTTATAKIDSELTRLVEDRVYGYRRTKSGNIQYATSLISPDGAIPYRNGVRLSNALKINADRFIYFAKQELVKGKIDEAIEFYERAMDVDPRDGRAYLGLSHCAQRRKDWDGAKKWLTLGIQNSVSYDDVTDTPDKHANPFLLQALGVLEERTGNWPRAESLYEEAIASRPSHAAAWVALALLRVQKLGQNIEQGRRLLATAEREIDRAGKKQSSHVYTAWASLEAEFGDPKAARNLFRKAIAIDPQCSAAWLQLGVLETQAFANYDDAAEYFETILKFDARNARVLQAYGILEAKRGNSRAAIGWFERALTTHPRDAAIYQAYAIYVAELGDVESARNLLRKGTQVNKRHAALWQAWGVLEFRNEHYDEARRIFQEGIWNCGQLNGRQSGGYHCARLWQAWGVLESTVGDHAAARRCFNRALDAAHEINVPAIVAWATMEERLGEITDARAIYERALSRFAPGSKDKMSLWRSYELMEQRIGDAEAAKAVYQRSMRETLFATKPSMAEERDTTVVSASAAGRQDDRSISIDTKGLTEDQHLPTTNNQRRNLKKEVEVVRWESSGGEVWMNDRAIETKVPFDMKKRGIAHKKKSDNHTDSTAPR